MGKTGNNVEDNRRAVKAESTERGAVFAADRRERLRGTERVDTRAGGQARPSCKEYLTATNAGFAPL